MGTGVRRWWVGGGELGTPQPRPGLACPGRRRRCCLSPGPSLGATLSSHLAPQIEPASHHLSPEEVRIGVLGRQGGAGNTVLGYWLRQVATRRGGGGGCWALTRHARALWAPCPSFGCAMLVPGWAGGWGLALQWAAGGS